MKVKICGLKEPQHVKAAVENGADMIGFVFAPSSRQIAYEEAHQLAKKIPKTIKKVGVFVNPTMAELELAIKTVPLDIVQLHGQEAPEFAATVSVPVIKAFPIRDGKLPEDVTEYHDCYLLLDAPPAEFEGGSGKTFDWESVNLAKLKNAKIIIAGGLTAENVQTAIEYFQPYAVDVSSGVETDGRKDTQKIHAFLKNAKK